MHPSQIGTGKPPDGYANWKEWANEQVTRKQALRELRDHLTAYHGEHVRPMQAHLGMPTSELCFERAKRWPERELVWPPRTPWWWDRLTAWLEPKLADVADVFAKIGVGGEGEDG